MRDRHNPGVTITWLLLASLALGAGVALIGRGAAPVGAQEAAPKATVPKKAAPQADASGAGALTAQQAIDAHLAATRGPEQPIPFNHRFHAGELRMDCMYCHTGTESSQVAVVPSLSICMGCHRLVGSQLEPIQELRGYSQRGEPVPWKRIHKLPEFVQFSHQPHLRNGLDCSECHGAVKEMDRVYQFSSLKMGWCLKCHMGEPQPTDVATDHLLAKRFPPPASPGGRQSVGLYPVQIDERYAKSRAPIDCATCHY